MAQNLQDKVSQAGGFEHFFSDLGGVAHPVTTEVIDVEIGAESMLRAYGEAVIAEAQRTNPTLFNVEPLTIEEIMDYAQFLLHTRVGLVNGYGNIRPHHCKPLWIPVFIQHVLAAIGIVDYYKVGLRVRPKVSVEPYSLEEAVAFSYKLSKYRDGLQMVQNAMPSDFKGDPDVMSCAIIDDYVRSFKQDTHPAAAYVAAFAGLQLIEQASLSALYRIQYDDTSFINGMIRNARGIL